MKFDSFSNQVYIVAINEAKLQSHEYVMPEHILYSILMFNEGRDIIESSGGYAQKITSELQLFFNKYLQKTNEALPIESFAFVKLIEVAASQAAGSAKNEISIGDMLVAILSLPECFAAYILKKNGVDKLAILQYISHGMKEKQQRIQSLAQQKFRQYEETNPLNNEIPKEKINGNNESQKENPLHAYAADLTEKARSGKLDPLIGREDIVELTMQVLCRRKKNNPIHVGDAGVGKTAIVEGLALKIAKGEKIPISLATARIFEIDMGSIVAGTRYRGDFEERFIKILNAASRIPNAIIYIDEIHNIANSGAASNGSMDAIGILKPYLTRGDLRFIGATTYEEYKKHFEKHSALTRRFQKIDVEEMSISDSVCVLEGIKSKYEIFHSVVYSTEIIKNCCELAGKYINDRKLPDKAIDIIDETGAYLRMNAQNNEVVAVTAADIEKTVARMAKIPQNSVTINEITILSELEQKLKEEIFGQDRAVSIIADAIKASRSGLNDSEKPVCNLLFVGPTGVGKTEIARQLAKIMNIKLLRFDMSEYQERHSVARLIGSPPGYVGYENGGLLTDEIRRNPYCILLLDEIEKAHPDIFNVLLQVMDYGVLTDNSGKKADFRNAMIIMTSNAGAREIGKRLIGFDDNAIKYDAIEKEVERVFSPEFRNRLDEIVPFKNIDKDMALSITEKAIAQLAGKVKNKLITIKTDDDVLTHIATSGLSKTYGAREIMRIVNKEIKKQLSEALLFGNIPEGYNTDIYITLVDGKIKIRINGLPH